MFKALVKTRLAALRSWLTRSATSSGKRASKLKLIGIGALLLYALFAFMAMFGVYFAQIAEPLFSNGLGWLYFTLFALTAFALMFIGSVFTAKTQLYEARDNDLLLSMPIPPKYILASRLIMLLIFNLIFELMVAIPAAIMWIRASSVSAGAMLSFIILLLALSFFSMAVSGLFGWLLSLATSRLQKKSLMTVLLSLIFLGLYFFLFSQANFYIQRLVINSGKIASSLAGISPLFWIGNAVAEPNVLHLIYTLIILLLPFLIMYRILSATFISVATSKRGFNKKKYVEKSLRSSSLSVSLFQRELKRLLSSSVYILNSGLGVIFIIVAAVALIIKKADIMKVITQLGADKGIAVSVFVLGLCLLAGTILLSAPSVSLEGKTVWILKSLPIPTEDILKAKLQLHIRLALPAIFLACVSSALVLTPSAISTVCLFLAPVFFVMLSANIGLICNLKHPNFDWINETQVIKQSISVLLSMLFCTLLALVPGALYLAAFSGLMPEYFLIFYTVFLAVGWRISYRWIMKNGVFLFDNLAA
jgi:ABC-2 type transport system permease protein